MIANVKNKKLCLFCGTLILGRSDKKFCDDSCRNNYHYQMRKYSDDNSMVIKTINESLLYNRDILKSFVNKNNAVVKKKNLIDNNFNFEFVTNACKTKKGIEYRVVYDYAYRILDDDEVLLFRFR